MTRNKPGHRWPTLKRAPVLTQELQIAKLKMVNRNLSIPNTQTHAHTHAHEHTHTHAQAGHFAQHEALVLDAPRVGRAPVHCLLNGRVVALAQPLQTLQIRAHAHGRMSTSERGMRGIRGIREILSVQCFVRQGPTWSKTTAQADSPASRASWGLCYAGT